MNNPPKDLFKRYATPPTPLHDAVQKWARKEGWTPPWDREEQQKEQQHQKKAAGKKSALARGERADLRRLIIQAAYARLNPAQKHQPYSNASIDALKEEYLSLLGKGAPLPRTAPTDDELELFTSAVSAITQLPEPDRLDALSDEYDSLLYKSHGAPRPTMTEEAFDLGIAVLKARLELSEADLQALQQVSRETLRKGLMQLGIKSKRRTK